MPASVVQRRTDVPFWVDWSQPMLEAERVWWVVMAGLWATACALTAWRYPARIGRARAAGWPELAELAVALEDARDDAQRVAEVEQALDDVAHTLVRDAALPAKLTWLDVSGSMLIIVLGVITTWQATPLAGIACTIVGVVAIQLAKRVGTARALRARAEVDARVRSLTGDLYDRAVARVTRRRK
jgi:hypothetical protein